MTRRAPRHTTPAAPAAPLPPPTAEELLTELRRHAARKFAFAVSDADHKRNVLARLRPGEASSDAWSYTSLVATEAAAAAWREVIEMLGERERP